MEQEGLVDNDNQITDAGERIIDDEIPLNSPGGVHKLLSTSTGCV